MHGWTGTAEQYFGIPSRPQMKNLFDNMIQNGDCAPFIAVSPTWDKDNRAKDWGESTQEVAVFSMNISMTLYLLLKASIQPMLRQLTRREYWRHVTIVLSEVFP